VLNGLSLRIKNRAFRHHPNMCFHNAIITVAQPFLAVCVEAPAEPQYDT
jgi:hypothetical protein